jgi:acyl-CoA thioester hydrolase
MTEAAPTFVYQASIRYSDLDPQGHVNNAQYLVFLEDARIAFFRHIGIPQAGIPPEAETGTSRVIARTEIDYLAAIHYEKDPIEVETSVLKLGSKSFTLDQRVVCRGALCARAKVVLVAYDPSNEASRPLDDTERSGLQTYLAAPAQ